MNIDISIPQEDQEHFSLLISAISKSTSIASVSTRNKDCEHYGDGFMINYRLLIPIRISVPNPTTTILDKIKNQIINYLSNNERAITVTNSKGHKILFQSPFSAQNNLDLDLIFNELDTRK